MAIDLAIIIVLGLLVNAVFTKIKLPGLLGMIIVGILIGPYGFNLLSSDILKVSADFRKIALIIILLRAGFGISKEDLKKVLYIIGAGILLTKFEDLIKSKVEIAGLLGVMTIGFIMLELNPRLGKDMAIKLNKIWVFAEILLL